MLKLSFTCVNSLKRMKDELKPRQIVVEPLRAMFVTVKEEL